LGNKIWKTVTEDRLDCHILLAFFNSTITAIWRGKHVLL